MVVTAFQDPQVVYSDLLWQQHITESLFQPCMSHCTFQQLLCVWSACSVLNLCRTLAVVILGNFSTAAAAARARDRALLMLRGVLEMPSAVLSTLNFPACEYDAEQLPMLTGGQHCGNRTAIRQCNGEAVTAYHILTGLPLSMEATQSTWQSVTE